MQRLFSVLALSALSLTLASASTIVDVYAGPFTPFTSLNTYFTGIGYTVNQLTSTFTSLAGANFVILGTPEFALSTTQLAAIDTYVNAGGRLLLNSEGNASNTVAIIADVNSILTSLGSTIVNQSTISQSGFHDTTQILSNAFTAGVSDVNYGLTSSLTGGTALVDGNPITDNGQEFIAYQAIGSGDVFVIADGNTATNINSTATNNNGTLYCNFGGLSCETQSSVPEPTSLLFVGIGLIGIARQMWRRAASAAL